MKRDTKANAVLGALAAVFGILAVGFLFGGFGGAATLAAPELAPTPKVFTHPATIRLSARELVTLEEDTSGMMCYSCHDPKKKLTLKRDVAGLVTVSTNHLDLVYSRLNCAGCHRESEEVELEWDDDDILIIPPAHRQPPMRHGRFGRNNDCFNCHIPEQLDKLRTRDGKEFNLTDSTLLCASCHGPSYRDWELGVHGRRNGYWDRQLGESTRRDCTSCHDPHSPAFPAMIPGPGPHQRSAAATGPLSEGPPHE